MEAPFPGCPELSAWHAHSLASQAPARRQALKRSSSGGDDDEAAKRARNRAEVSPPPPSLRRSRPLPSAPSPSHLTAVRPLLWPPLIITIWSCGRSASHGKSATTVCPLTTIRTAICTITSAPSRELFSRRGTVCSRPGSGCRPNEWSGTCSALPVASPFAPPVPPAPPAPPSP